MLGIAVLREGKGLADEKKETELSVRELLKKKRKEILVGALVAVLLIAAGAAIFRSFLQRAPEPQSVAQEADTGLIDWDTVIQSHPDYDQYKSLQDECKTLALETQDVSDLLAQDPVAVNPPTVDAQPFDDSVWQKNALDVVGARAELERKAHKIREEYTNATQAEYDARRKAIDDEYLNAILNINIKLDNQASMHNAMDKPADIAAERQEWLDERDQLQQERGQKQMQLAQARQQDIDKHVQDAMAPDLAQWQQRLATTKQQQESGAALKQSEAQQRDTEAMQKQMELAQQVQERLEKRKELQDKQSQLQALETHILNDVAGKAAKIAIMHHFTLILVNHPQTLMSFDTNFTKVNPLAPTKSIAVGITTEDVTDELAAEVKTLPKSDTGSDGTASSASDSSAGDSANTNNDSTDASAGSSDGDSGQQE